MTYEQSSLAKISDTQKVIKNKFIKAYSNRVDHENDVNETMKPLICRRRTTTTTTTEQTNKNDLFKSNDINELCIRLQKLVNSQICRNCNYSQEIKIIINKLHELGIIM